MIFKNLSEEHQSNIIILRDGLVSMYGTVECHPNFNMWIFQSTEELITEHTCNTSACLLGHGPIFGIGDFTGDWYNYSEDYFGINFFEWAWEFLFSSMWTNNTQEATARLSLYIDGFDPSSEDWCDDNLYVKQRGVNK